MRNTMHNLIAAFAVVALTVGFAPPATAQDNPAGAVVLKNESGAELTITNMRYVDSLGNTQTLTGEWKLKVGFYGHLVYGPNQTKIYAKKITYDLVTDDGKTEGWSCQSTGLDAGGNFSSLFTADNLASHQKLLGKEDGAKATLARARAAEREKVRQEISNLADEIRKIESRIDDTKTARGLAVIAYNFADEGTNAEKLAKAAIVAADIALFGFNVDLRRQQASLRAAQNRLNSLPE